MRISSAIYRGDVVHERFKPRKHGLRYRVFSLLIDLDELPLLDRRLRLFGHNRRAVFSVHDKDHGHGEEGGLRAWAEERLKEAGLASGAARISMLCYPRILGYVFNPLTVYFCHDDKDGLVAVLYEVCNTFHERHTYIIPAQAEQGGDVRHACAKEMYVSPFVPMDCLYRFRIRPPAEGVLIAIHESDAEGPLLYAAFAGRRHELTDRSLMTAFLSYPLMTLKVMGAIHWEALRLWLKGVPVFRHRKAENPVASSVIHPKSMSPGSPS
ncbi:DUF1365 domain-containing protein [Allorhizobium undicola]|uniref:DUF1365 domain-containing protein n=1 Tax=Allorhizobium undicola TaxID=78527 RepID=UPI003D33BC6B